MPKRKRDVEDMIISSPSPRSVVVIPQDVVLEEILVKLPVKSLVRFKAVSKPWRREIESRRFQERHLRHQQKSRDPSVLLVEFDYDTSEASLRTLSVGATSMSMEKYTRYTLHPKTTLPLKTETETETTTRSCDGLTCLYSDTLMYVINPATGWYRKLPEARFQSLVQAHLRDDIVFPFPFPLLGFGKDDIAGIYKLVWLYNSHYLNLDGQTNTCEVFSFDTNNTWRDVVASSPHEILHEIPPAHVHGSLHWFIDAITERQVLSLDLHTETFAVMEKIPVAYAPRNNITMCTLNNCLCLSEDRGGTQHIWSFNKDSMTWDKTYSINLRSTLSCVEDIYLFSTPPIATLSNNRLLLYDFSDQEDKLVLHDLRQNSYTFFTASCYLGGAISFSQSLITLP